jgi:hypothetical protein
MVKDGMPRGAPEQLALHHARERAIAAELEAGG